MYTTSASAWFRNATTSANEQDDYGASNDETSLEDYDEIVWSAVAPNWLEYASLGVFAILLITGLVGNFLVMFVVLRNESMRTMTNYFLVNLALSDFMVLLLCLPFTILWVSYPRRAQALIFQKVASVSGNYKNLVVRYGFM